MQRMVVDKDQIEQLKAQAAVLRCYEDFHTDAHTHTLSLTSHRRAMRHSVLRPDLIGNIELRFPANNMEVLSGLDILDASALPEQDEEYGES